MAVNALLIVLLAAALHAIWNLIAKQLGGGAAVAVTFLSVGVIAWIPVVVVAVGHGASFGGPRGLAWATVGGSLQAVYFVLLQRAYRHGDLSVVYPLARGSGPLFAVAGGVLIYAETPGTAGILGAIAVSAGAVVLLGGSWRRVPSGAGWAVAVGTVIASYTLWDRYGVADLGASPWLYLWVGELVAIALLLPRALRDVGTMRRVVRTEPLRIVTVGVLQLAAYGLVLAALAIAPVSAVAPVREVSVVLAAVLGAVVLREPVGRARVLGAAIIAAGVIAIAVS